MLNNKGVVMRNFVLQEKHIRKACLTPELWRKYITAHKAKVDAEKSGNPALKAAADVFQIAVDAECAEHRAMIEVYRQRYGENRYINELKQDHETVMKELDDTSTH